MNVKTKLIKRKIDNLIVSFMQFYTLVNQNIFLFRFSYKKKGLTMLKV